MDWIKETLMIARTYGVLGVAVFVGAGIIATYVSRLNTSSLENALLTLNTNIATLQQVVGGVDKKSEERTSNTRQELDGEIAKQADGLQENNKQLAILSASIGELSNRMKAVEMRMANSDDRQIKFERELLKIAIKTNTPLDQMKDWRSYWGVDPEKVDEGFIIQNQDELSDLLRTYMTKK